MFTEWGVIDVRGEAKGAAENAYAEAVHSTTRTIKTGLRGLHKKLGRRPTPDEVELLLKEMELPYKRHAAVSMFSNSDGAVHSFRVRMKDSRIYVCETMGDDAWAVL